MACRCVTRSVNAAIARTILSRDGVWIRNGFIEHSRVYPEDGGDTFFRNVDLHNIYTASHPHKMAFFIITAVITSNLKTFITFSIKLKLLKSIILYRIRFIGIFIFRISSWHCEPYASRDDSVGIAVSYELDGTGFIPGREKRNVHSAQTDCGAYPSLIQWVPWPGREADHSLPSSPVLKNGGAMPTRRKRVKLSL
jgi:hypothetical protein